MDGLTWGDSGSKTATEKVLDGMSAYERRYGHAPTILYVFSGHELNLIRGIRIVRSVYMQNNRFFFSDMEINSYY